ncbi:MAG: hypothetical protein IJZ74_01925 [Clostridia bacterium]|nr:hypothetical protein [Clostridia bacterium]
MTYRKMWTAFPAQHPEAVGAAYVVRSYGTAQNALADMTQAVLPFSEDVDAVCERFEVMYP